MNLLSINVGLPREIQWQGKVVRTSIFKSPVSGDVRVSKLNLEGDQQSDLSVHGGVHKAVYAYPSEHYEFWRGQIAAGGSIKVLTRDEHGVTVANIVNLYQADATNQELLRRASDLPALPADWRDHFRKRLWNADG
jgi:MOSC domain-containing protein YiiM